MDLAIILTYRCNSKCSMCYSWQNPTMPKEEVSLETLDKIPYKLDHLNLTGGEPTLRSDLAEIVNLLFGRAATFEISSNGMYAERLEPIIRKYPDIKLRFSLEGSEATNNRIRGEKDGFRKKINSLLRLKELGGTDLGFATTIQDDNAEQLVELFHFCEANGLEFSTSALHNGFQFHKNNNIPYDRLQVASQIERLIVAEMRTRTIKNWFRAYLNLGLIAKVLGQDRLLPCTAGTDFVFVDPWSDVYGCNVRPDLKLGNLQQKSWNDLLDGSTAKEIRAKVSRCKQNCWMVGSAKTAMRNPRLPSLPKRAPLTWVLANKLRLTLGKRVPFEKYVDYSRIHQDRDKPNRSSFLHQTGRKRIHSKDDKHYIHLGEYVNR